jgi:hypothetical protein
MFDAIYFEAVGAGTDAAGLWSRVNRAALRPLRSFLKVRES